MLRAWSLYALGAVGTLVLAASCTQDFDQFFNGPETITVGGTGGTGNHGGTGNTGGTNPGGGGAAPECVNPTPDCGNPNTCRPWTCILGVCGSENAAIDTACTDAGGAACDGAGTCVECTDCAGCNGTIGCQDPNVCSQWQCVPAHCINATFDPGEGETDVDCGGTCPGCLNTLHCTLYSDCASQYCNAGHCEACATTTNCAAASGTWCDTANNGGTCVPTLGPGDGCTAGEQCTSGNCPTGGVCCSTPCTGPCEACANGMTGLNNGTCGPVSSVSDPGGDCLADPPCGLTGNCNGTTAACAYTPLDTACGSPIGCSAGTAITHQATCDSNHECTGEISAACAPYVCNGTACFADCSGGSTACDSNAYCNTTPDPDVCAAKKPDGDPCSVAEECQHLCNTRDSVCCNVACSGPCRTCLVANMQGTGGSSGTCDDVETGTDPYDGCGTGGAGGAPNLCAANGICGT